MLRDDYPVGSRRTLALAAPALAMAMASLDQNIIAPALPGIATTLGSAEQLSWIASAFMLTATVTMPLHGRLSDRYGRGLLLGAAIIIFVLASLAAGLVTSMPAMVVARATQGIGAGGLISLSQALLADIIPPAERGRYQGLFASIFGVCSLLGPYLGGLITDLWSWRWIFLINVPLGAVTLAVLALAPQRSRHVRVDALDIRGALAFLIASAAALMLVESTGRSSGGKAWFVALVSLALVSGAYFVRRERHGQPLFPRAILRSGAVTRTMAIMLLLGGAMFAGSIFVPLYLQSARGLSATMSGFLLVPMTVGIMVAAFAGGRLHMPRALITLPRVGLAISLVASLAASALVAVNGSLAGFIVALCCIGIGIGLAQPALVANLQNSVAREDLGIVTSTATFCRSLGGTFGIAVAGVGQTVLSARLPGDASMVTLAGTLGIAAICYLLALRLASALVEGTAAMAATVLEEGH
ncbi:MAG TPA: MFS transporter [Steroidobacter sp.]